MAVHALASLPFVPPQYQAVFSSPSLRHFSRSSSQLRGSGLGTHAQHASQQCNLMVPNPEAPKERVVKRLLEALQKDGANVQKVLREQGPSIKPNHWLLVLDEVGKRRRWLLALEIFRWMQLQKWYKPERAYYWKMVFILGREQQLRIVRGLFEEMKNSGLRPSTSIYNAVIAAHVAMPDIPGNLEKGVGLLMEMKKTRSRTSQPDIVTYNSLIRAFAQVGDLDRVHSLFQDLQKARVKPVVHTFNLILGSYGKLGNIEKMEYMYGMMKVKKCKPDSVTFSSLMSAYCRAGEIQRADGLLERMVNYRKIQAEDGPFNMLMDAYGRLGNLEKVEDVAQKLISAGMTPSAITFDIMIRAYGKAGSFDRMKECVQTMKAARLGPSYATFKFMVEVLCERRQFDRAEEALEEALHSGWVRDDTLYNILLKSYAVDGRTEDIERMLCRMEEVGVPDFSRALTMDQLGSSFTDKPLPLPSLHARGEVWKEAFLDCVSLRRDSRAAGPGWFKA